MKDVLVKIFPSGQVYQSNNILGHEGEHISRNLIIKQDGFFIDGIGLLEIEREINGEIEKEVLTMDNQDGTFILPIYESLLTANEIKMQLLIMVDEEVIFKSDIFKFKVGNSINAKDKALLEEYASYIYKFDEKIAEIDKLLKEIKNGNYGGGDGSGTGLLVSFDSLTQEQKDSLKGPQGEPGQDGINGQNGLDGKDGVDGKNGADGQDGKDGENGATFTPSIDEEGNLSWTNDKGLPNPEPINIKGIQGEQGIQGIQGEPGKTYAITDEDYQNIAEIAISKLTNAEEVKY